MTAFYTQHTDQSGRVTETLVDHSDHGTVQTEQGAFSEMIRATDGAKTRFVQDFSELLDHEVVSVAGMEMRVDVARSLGYLSKPAESTRAVAVVGEATPKPMTPAEVIKSREPATPYESAVNSVAFARDAGAITAEEAQVAETMILQGELVGMAPEVIEEAATAYLTGTSAADLAQALGGYDRVSQITQGIEQAQSQMTKVAQRELGADTFSELSRLASQHPAIGQALAVYGVQRLTGKANGATFRDFMEDVREFLRSGN